MIHDRTIKEKEREAQKLWLGEQFLLNWIELIAPTARKRSLPCSFQDTAL